MTINRFKMTLSSARFPLISTKASRAVFTPGLDSAPRTSRQYIGAEEAVDYNLAQLLYAENIMPVAEGFTSTRADLRIPGPTPAVSNFNSMVVLRDAEENNVLYSPSANSNYVYKPLTGVWEGVGIEAIYALTLASGYDPLESKVTYAYIEGITFVCYSRLKSTTNVDMSLTVYDAPSQYLLKADTLVTNSPFAAGTIDGISASNGYLIMWSGITVAWARYDLTSASFNFSSFENGEPTGAGSAIPEDIKGQIAAILPASGGFIIFTTKNAVAANYHANNLQFPFLFREVPNAGGIRSYEQATTDTSLGLVYAYTTTGLQKVTLNSATTIHPQVADFLTGGAYETFNRTTDALNTVIVGDDLAMKLACASNRYLCISYGVNNGAYDYLIIIDLALERFGKVKFTHTDCFQYVYALTVNTGLPYARAQASYTSYNATTYAATAAAPDNVELFPAEKSIGLLTSAGNVYVLLWDEVSRTTNDSVLIFGRVQLSRSRHTQLNRVEIEGLTDGVCTISPSYDGRILETSIPLYEVQKTDDYYLGGAGITCKNFNLNVKGSGTLSTVIFEATTGGQW